MGPKKRGKRGGRGGRGGGGGLQGGRPVQPESGPYVSQGDGDSSSPKVGSSVTPANGGRSTPEPGSTSVKLSPNFDVEKRLRHAQEQVNKQGRQSRLIQAFKMQIDAAVLGTLRDERELVEANEPLKLEHRMEDLGQEEEQVIERSSEVGDRSRQVYDHLRSAGFRVASDKGTSL